MKPSRTLGTAASAVLGAVLCLVSCSAETGDSPSNGNARGGKAARGGGASTDPKATGGGTATGGSTGTGTEGPNESSGGSTTASGGSDNGSGGSDSSTGGTTGNETGGTTGNGAAAGTSGSGGSNSSEVCPGGATPPDTWKEHWFEHAQTVKLVYHDDCVAVYFDDDVDRDKAKWLYSFASKVWEYSLKTYGKMGEERMFFIFHQGKYSGGHPSYWYSDSHDKRNLSDVGGGDWSEGPNYDVTSHEVAHVVESTAFYPKSGSPAFSLWGDSKWAEFFQYDLYMGLGMTEEAERVFKKFSAGSDNLPPNGVKKAFWFRDWFYPLWRDHGGAQVMVKFYQLLRDNFSGDRIRDLNFGEYVHFMSGAAGKNLQPLAEQAFGWKTEWTNQLNAAKGDFAAVDY